MRTKTISGVNVPAALREVGRVMGDDALVLRTHHTGAGADVVVTTSEEVFRFGSLLRNSVPRRKSGRRPRVIALVGPTGSGKTTTLAKLGLSEHAFGWGRVGLISLDTYKIGALEQIQTYADVGGMPLELVRDPSEVQGVMSRYGNCDTILIDTPGRTPRATATERSWRDTLKAFEPDETHLVVSAGVRLHVAESARSDYSDLALTHSLLTKLDEIPDEAGVAEVADQLGLPANWITDGQLVPDDLHEASDRIMAAAFRGGVTDSRLELYG